MRKIILFSFGMLFVFTMEAVAAERSKVQALRFWTESDHTRVVFDLSETTARKIFLLDGPDRLVIDLENTRLATRVQQPGASIPTFRRIRYARRNQNDLRVVLDLKRKVRPNSFILKPDRKFGHRLVLDLYERAATKTAETAPAVKTAPPTSNETADSKRAKNSSKKESLAKSESLDSIPTPDSNAIQLARNDRNQPAAKHPADPPRAVSTKRYDDFVVAIDAGHGGNDPGAKGANGTHEKDVVLKIAKKLGRLIAREPGMRPLLVRDGDYYLGLRKRMRVARAADADIFVSIHADAFHQSNIRGSSVYTLSQKGATSEAARWLAAKENESDLIGGVSLDDKDEMLAGVLLDLSQTATRDASADLASKVLENLRKLGRAHKRTVQSAGFAVLKSPDIPSILVETAFISNPDEEKNLRNHAYQNKLARAILAGIRNYYRQRALPAMRIAARKHVIEPGETLSGIAAMYGLSTRQIQAANTLNSTRIKVGQILEIPEGS